MTAYYNEIDPYDVAWLRNLIAAGHIAPGIVDERSIEDVYPSDLRGFTQCHFFAGIGVWSHALRRAGWSDDRPVWTGSCPCQPFSKAGKGAGFADERHLWPAFGHLIGERNPAVLLGEQVANSDADPWIDLVQDDLEGLGYRFGAVPFPAAGVGAPNIRDRTYWVAHAYDARLARRQQLRERGPERAAGAGRLVGRVEHAGQHDDAGQVHATSNGQPEAYGPSDQPGRPSVPSGGLAYIEGGGRRQERADAGRGAVGNRAQGVAPGSGDGVSDLRLGPTNGLWDAADWIFCRDGKWRPVEPGTFPLVDGPAARMGQDRADWHTPAGAQGFGHRAGRLKGYGNAINAEAARVFIECVMESA